MFRPPIPSKERWSFKGKDEHDYAASIGGLWLCVACWPYSSVFWPSSFLESLCLVWCCFLELMFSWTESLTWWRPPGLQVTTGLWSSKELSESLPASLRSFGRELPPWYCCT